MMAQAAGFPCLHCGQSDLATITNPKDLVHILELKCVNCGGEWSVESAHATGRWLDGKGRMDDGTAGSGAR